MGIYIPNMVMPKTCQICRTAKFDRIVGCEEWDRLSIAQRMYMRSETCPLVPLPEGHGPLIDADALDRAFTDLRFNSDGTLNHWGDRPGWCMHGYEVEKLIADAPTIVPAEGGTDDVRCL